MDEAFSDMIQRDNAQHLPKTLFVHKHCRNEIFLGDFRQLHGHAQKCQQRIEALRRTRERRPDMYEKLDLSSKQDKKLLKEMEEEDAT